MTNHTFLYASALAALALFEGVKRGPMRPSPASSKG